MRRVCVVDVSATETFSDIEWWKNIFNAFSETDSIILTGKNNDDLKKCMNFFKQIDPEQNATYEEGATNVNPLDNFDRSSGSRKSLIKGTFKKVAKKARQGLSGLLNQSAVEDGFLAANLAQLQIIFTAAKITCKLGFLNQNDLTESTNINNVDTDQLILFGDFPFQVKEPLKAQFHTKNKYFALFNENTTNNQFPVSIEKAYDKNPSPIPCSKDYFSKQLLSYVQDDCDETIFVNAMRNMLENYEEKILKLSDFLFKTDGRPWFLLSADDLSGLIESIPKEVSLLDLASLTYCLDNKNSTIEQACEAIFNSIPMTAYVIKLSNTTTDEKKAFCVASKFFVKSKDEECVFYNKNRKLKQKRTYQKNDSYENNTIAPTQKLSNSSGESEEEVFINRQNSESVYENTSLSDQQKTSSSSMEIEENIFVNQQNAKDVCENNPASNTTLPEEYQAQLTLKDRRIEELESKVEFLEHQVKLLQEDNEKFRKLASELKSGVEGAGRRTQRALSNEFFVLPKKRNVTQKIAEDGAALQEHEQVLSGEPNARSPRSI